MAHPHVIRNSGSLKFKDSSRKNGRESTIYHTNKSSATQNSGRCHPSKGYDGFPNTFTQNYNKNLQQHQFALTSLVNNPKSGDNVGEYQGDISQTNKLVYEAEINRAKHFNQYGPNKQCSYNAPINTVMKDSLNVDKFNPVSPKSIVKDAKLSEADNSRWDASNRQSSCYVPLNKEKKDSFSDGKFDHDRVNNLVDVSGLNCSKGFGNYVSKDNNKLKDLLNGYKFNHGRTDNPIDETGFSWTKRSSRNALNSPYGHYVPKDRLKDPISVLKTKMISMPTKTRFRQASLDEFIGDINALPKIKTKKTKRKENSIQPSKENR